MFCKTYKYPCNQIKQTAMNFTFTPFAPFAPFACSLTLEHS